MPITPEQQMQYEQLRANNALEISAYDYYFDKVRPYLQQIQLQCKSDPELTRTIDKVINAGDSFCQAKKYPELSSTFDVLYKAITDKNYFNGAMKKGTEAEKQMVRDLVTKISDLKTIIQFEKPVAEEEPKTRDRLNYFEDGPNGHNQDYNTHNMEKLNTPSPKGRIPNIQ